MMKTPRLLTLLLGLSFLASSALGGARPLDGILITNATPGDEPAISKRLYELLQKDIVFIFDQDRKFEFAWESGTKLTDVPCPDGVFKPMIIVEDPKAIAAMCKKAESHDGLIVYEYDAKGRVARLKYFDYEGKERILIRLPLEADGPMKDSIFRHTRRAAIVAIGGAVDFNP